MSKLEILTPTSPRWNEFLGQLSVAVLLAGCKPGFDYAERIMDAMGAINIPEASRTSNNTAATAISKSYSM